MLHVPFGSFEGFCQRWRCHDVATASQILLHGPAAAIRHVVIDPALAIRGWDVDRRVVDHVDHRRLHDRLPEQVGPQPCDGLEVSTPRQFVGPDHGLAVRKVAQRLQEGATAVVGARSRVTVLPRAREVEFRVGFIAPRLELNLILRHWKQLADHRPVVLPRTDAEKLD